MAKKKKTLYEQYKKFGSIVAGNVIAEEKYDIIPVSPAIDVKLGGGFREGTWVNITGKPKVGKTSTILQFLANAQQEEHGSRKVYYLDVEKRLSPQNVQGIHNLKSEEVEVISSSDGHLMSAEEYLNLAKEIINDVPKCVLVIDSVSALCAEDELTGEITGKSRLVSPRILASFCRQVGQVVPMKKSIVVNVTHITANMSGMGSSLHEDGGNKIQFQSGTKLKCKYTKPWFDGDDQIGQEIYWKVAWSSVGSPGGECKSYLRYGYGLDDTMELVDMGLDFGLISKRGTWYMCGFLQDKLEEDDKVASYAKEKYVKKDKEEMFKMQGQNKVCTFLGENAHFKRLLYKEVREMI